MLIILSVSFIILTSDALPNERWKRDSQTAICYGYDAYTDSSYDVSVSGDQGLVTLNCCQMDAVYVSRWRKLENRSQVRLPVCRDGRLGDEFACWKYQSRLLVRLLVNATNLRRVGKATFLCGKEPLWNDDFYVTTTIRLAVPPTALRPTILPVRPRDSNCSVTLSETSPTDRRYALGGSVTCLSDFNRLVWKAGDESIGKCADDSGMPAACYEESDGGLELKIFSQEKRGLKKFKCIGRRVGNEEPGSVKSRVCTVKVSWT